MTDDAARDERMVDAAKITVLALLGVVMVLVCFAYSLFTTMELPGMLPDPDPIPYARLQAPDLAHDTDWIDDPAAVSALGDASSTQCVAVLDVRGWLWAMTSDDLFVNNTRRCLLADLGDGPFEGATLELGRTAGGAFGLRLSLGGEERYWVMVGGPKGWEAVEGGLPLIYPRWTQVATSGLPYPKNLDHDGASISALRVDGTDVVVTEYSYCGGCTEEHLFPSIVFSTPDGRWSNIVCVEGVYGRTWDTSFCFAGSSMDDMFIVIAFRNDHDVRWTIVPLEGDDLRQAGTRVIA